MSETSSRLLELLSLLQARRDWPGAELAERLEVSGRTIRRDIERLRALGYPVESLTGPAGGYRLRAGTAMPPLLLDEDEAIAIAVGLRTAARASVTGIEETSIRALVKLEQVLPAHLRRRVSALGSATIAPPVTGPTVDPQHLTVIAAACRESECLRFTYRSRDGSESRREVEPHSLVILGRRWYLVAWDRGREDWRTFRIDRLAAPGVERGPVHAPQVAGSGCGRLRQAEHHRGPHPLRSQSHTPRPRGALRRARSVVLGDDRGEGRTHLRVPSG
jgi:predicted DNA-binding transcriptional regulator YafY